MSIRLLLIILSTSTLSACEAQQSIDPDSPFGVWRASVYELDGVEHQQDGLIIVTPDYLMSNTIFQADNDDIPDGNANSGPISFDGDVIVMEQWMQLHWRTEDTGGNFLTQGVVERIPYIVEGDSLIFHFPSGNRYISKRLAYLDSEAVVD